MHKLQQKYGNVKGTMQMVSLTERLAWMQQAKVLIDEAFTIT